MNHQLLPMDISNKKANTSLQDLARGWPLAQLPTAMVHHKEPVLRDGVIVGFVTSGAFLAAQGSAVGLCLIEPPTGTYGGEAQEKGDYCVLVEGRIIPAILQRKAFAR